MVSECMTDGPHKDLDSSGEEARMDHHLSQTEAQGEFRSSQTAARQEPRVSRTEVPHEGADVSGAAGTHLGRHPVGEQREGRSADAGTTDPGTADPAAVGTGVVDTVSVDAGTAGPIAAGPTDADAAAVGPVAVIDGNSLMHRAFHAVPDYMTAPDGTPTNACFGFISMLIKLVETLHPAGIICAFDAGIPDFRFEAIEKYKAQRPPTDPNLKAQFPLIRELLEALAVPVIQEEGWEGDDILGTVAAHAEREGVRALLVSGDRDVLQLTSESVSIVTTKKGLSDVVVYTPEMVFERYGVYPSQVPDYLGLKGDTSDNIPGVPGVGEKTAAKLLGEYGTLEEIIAHTGDLKGKLAENIATNIDLAYASRKVATIVRDVPVDIDFKAACFPSFDEEVVRAAFAKLNFTSHLGKILAFVGASNTVSVGSAGSTAALIVEPVYEGDEASALVERAIEGGYPLAVAFEESGELSLFSEGKELYVATKDGIARFSNDIAPRVLVRMFQKGRVVTHDAKTLLQEVYPPDSAQAAALDYHDFDSNRVVDLSLAAYLLDSSRQGYALGHLCELYLSATVPEPTDGLPLGVIDAACALALHQPLLEMLDKDGSRLCFDTIEMPLVAVLARMERLGVNVDTEVLGRFSDDLGTRIDALRLQAYELAGDEFNLDSPKQLGEVLFEKLQLPTQRKNQRGYSTDAAVLAELTEKTGHPLPGVVLEYRELAKMKSTYLDALPRMIASDGRIHTSFNQTVAATGRLSSSDPNLQNIPVRTDLGRQIRAAFVPRALGQGAAADTVFLSADYSQIELRLLAHLSGDEGLIAAFTSGRDFHAATASRVFGVAPDEVTNEMRSRAKAVNFGIVYGQQKFGLAKSLGIGMGEAQDMIDRYFAAYPQVRIFLDETVAFAKTHGWVATMFGRKRHIKELSSSNFNQRAFGERTAMNHPMQGSAADIIKLAMIEVARVLDEEDFVAQMVLQVHDELDFICPLCEVERLSALVSDAMAHIVELRVPLEVSVAVGENWAAAK